MPSSRPLKSLNLISETINPAHSEHVLDEIMASLQRAAVLATQPIMETSQPRIPMATYPVIAVVTTTIALSARRKSKHPHSNLQFTRGK